MSGNMQVSMTLKAIDQASAVLKRTADNANSLAERAARMTKDGQSQAQRAYRQTEQVFRRSTADQTRLAERAAQTREQSGVRSENAVQREITQTEAAYRRVSQTGTASSNAQQQSIAALTNRVKALRSELHGITQQQEKMARYAKQSSPAGRGAAGSVLAVGAGVVAGAYMAARPIAETMSYDRRLAMMSNTAYSDSSLAGRQAGQRDLDAAIVHAVRTGGGTREEAADTLDSLLSSGALSQKSAVNLLPVLQKYATAANADPKQLGNIAVRSMQTFGIKEAEFPKALDMAIMAGQKGGFELKDMAQWLPKQMAAGKSAGLSGMSGFGALLAANQAAVITSGTKDEAGNNLTNLLNKIVASDTAKDAQKLHIDLAGTLLKARKEGTNGLDAFIGIVDHVVAKDPRYEKLKKRAAQTKDGEQQETFSAMANILEGTSIGKLVQDHEALKALVGLMHNRDYVKSIERQLPNASGTGEANFQTIAATDDFKVKQALNENAIAKQKALGGVNGTVGDSADWWTRFARDNPVMSTATSGGIEVGKWLGVAGGASLFTRLMSGGGEGSLMARMASMAPSAGTLGTTAAAVAPLAVMGGVTAWSQKEDKTAETTTLLSLSKWLDSFIGKQAEFDARREAQLKGLITTQIPINVTVKVENGNLVAEVNKRNGIDAGRF